MGLIDLVVCSMVSAVMLLMLLHRAAWRLIDRPLYALARFGIFNQKKVLWTVGIALIVGPPHLINISHWLLDKISGASG